MPSVSSLSSDPSAAPASAPELDIVLECRDIHHGFGNKSVLYDINLRIVRGEIVGLVGPSGCGKSTLLRAIVGTHPPREGAVLVRAAGQTSPYAVEGPGPDRGIVYQRYALFPFLTALENVALGPLLHQTSIPFRLLRFPSWRRLRKRHLEEAAALLAKLKLGDAMHQYPHQMSGGMCQRVAIAQALIMKPEILLLDEPFGALDEATREELQRTLLTLYQENCAAKAAGLPPPAGTIIIVTHELSEALYVGDRVVGLSPYWDWKAEGFASCPGAAIVYDKVAPVYRPDQEKDYDSFVRQREEIRRVVFDSTYFPPRTENLTFWHDVRNGRGEGVLK